MQMTPNRALACVIWAYAGFHLLIAALMPLVAHEAHYALYARHLALSYLDHPPLAAWLQAPIIWFSGSDFSLRLLPVGLSVLAMYLLAAICRSVYPDRSPWLPVVAVLLLQGTVVFHGSMTLSPDAPLLPIALALVLMTLKLQAGLIAEADQRDSATAADRGGLLSHWVLLGLLVGLAGLSKYTAVTLPVSLVMVLLAARGLRGLALPGLWLAGLVALVLISPVLFWNWQNDWATVRFHSDYQFEDIQRWSLAGFLESSAGQFLYYSPLVVIGGIAALLASWRSNSPAPRLNYFTRPEGALVLFVAPVLGLYLLTALESRASPHWSMLGWLLLIPLVAAWLIERWRGASWVRWLTGFSAATSVLTGLALLVLVAPIGKWLDFRHPARLFEGWQAATERGVALLEEIPDRGFQSQPVLLARNWHHAGLFEWYGPGVPLKNLFADLNPSNLRNGLADTETWGVLIYPWDSPEPRLENLTRDFDCQPIESMPAYHGDSLVQVFHFYACHSRMPGSAIAR